LDQSSHGSTISIVAVDSLTPEKLVLRAELGRALAKAAARLPRSLSDVFTRCNISGLSIRQRLAAIRDSGWKRRSGPGPRNGAPGKLADRQDPGPEMQHPAYPAVSWRSTNAVRVRRIPSFCNRS
jgi:hypothetical protein